MSFETLISNLLDDTLKKSLPGFMPELWLCITIVVMLLVRLPRFGRRFSSFYIALPGTLIALYCAAPWEHLIHSTEPGFSPAAVLRTPIFDGLLVYDTLTVYFRSVLLVFGVLFLFLTRLSGIPDREDSPDFYTLVLGGTLGMCIMASANHLFMVFLGIEMASVPSYALAGMLKGRAKSSEAALKYSVYGAGTAGVMLYGISLLAGALGSLHLPTMAQQLAHMPADVLAERQTVLLLGGLMLMVGLAFKLSAVPFHFWCPDVFEGASAEVDAFLSVASKAAALALLVRVAIGFSYAPAPTVNELAHRPAMATTQVAGSQRPDLVKAVALQTAGKKPSPAAEAPPANVLGKVRHYIVGLLALLAAITCTFGNLAAYGQTNIKRLLAYSTIAHAGYMMMPVVAAVAVLDDDPALAKQAIGALCFYVGVYLFMNLGAFAIVAFLRNAMRSEEISAYAGLIRRSPGLTICLSIVFISLLGLPPLAGFAAKFLAFAPLAANPTRYPLLFTLLVIGGLNTVISLFYYLRVVKVMALDPEPDDRVPISFSLTSSDGVYVALISIPVLVLGVWWDPLNRWAQAAAESLFS
ncbi:MAG TPA: NADH-quinone oxidoreductase subunit N [Pirellulales bacterium]|nr:NADH-quinone oxidoreductase subunit N [Pirellulales bacterium]